MAKIVAGEKAPQMKRLNRKLVTRTVDGHETADEQVLYRFDVLKIETALELSVSKGVWNLIKIGYKTVKGGVGGALKATNSVPATFFDLMGIVIDMNQISITCLKTQLLTR